MSRFVILTIALFAALAATARGDGGSVPGYDTSGLGVAGPDVRYTTVQTPEGSVVLPIDRHGGRVLTPRFLHRQLYVSLVAYDGSTTGLSTDGGTLVLADGYRPYLAKHSEFAVFDTAAMRRVATIRLRGDFYLDAMSPDAARLYLIQVLGSTRYQVRAYDLARGRLLRDPVVDPEDKEPLRGGPVTRVMSRDSRWAYTLYDGNGKHPFIHALDTVRGEAKCIDLEPRDDMFEMRLKLAADGTVLMRDGSGRPALAVDPRTFAVSEPRPAPPPPEDGGAAWFGLAAGLALLALLAFAAVRVGGRRVRRTAAG